MGQWFVHTKHCSKQHVDDPQRHHSFGCHRSGSPTGCRSYYDNIKVRILVKAKPRVITGNICRLPLHKYRALGGKMRPADSCKQIYDANLTGKSKSSAVNGVYWIKTARAGTKSGPTFCDMDKGGWTLVGKISGQVGNIFNSWLVRNVNSILLKSSGMNSGSIEYAAWMLAILLHGIRLRLCSRSAKIIPELETGGFDGRCHWAEIMVLGGIMASVRQKWQQLLQTK